MADPWKHPVFGMMTSGTETQFEHVYGVLFDAATGAPPTHVRLIDYSGLSFPPTAAPTNKLDIKVDGAMLMAITPQAATHLVAEIDKLNTELNEQPEPRRYHYADRIVPLPQRVVDKAERTAAFAQKFAAKQAGAKSRPTNCVHFLMQEAQRAGIDIAAIAPALVGSDNVDDVTRAIKRGMQSSVPTEGPFLSGKLEGDRPVLYWQADSNQDLLPLLQKIPLRTLHAWCDAAPLTRAHAARAESAPSPNAVITF